MVRPILTLLLCLMLLPAPARAGLDPHRREVIQSLFPSATVIGERRADLPVYPVYQLQELLGYAYESTDLSHLQGFAGKPIRMMIGLDTRGRFTGVRVLEHHEPVFLHGLGEAPLFDFVSQYAGHSLREQILIRTGSEARGKTVDGDPVYFDGVSKATVSVLIINDTVLSSALKVARQTLADFAQAPPTRVRPDVYRPLDWPGPARPGIRQPGPHQRRPGGTGARAPPGRLPGATGGRGRRPVLGTLRRLPERPHGRAQPAGGRGLPGPHGPPGGERTRAAGGVPGALPPRRPRVRARQHAGAHRPGAEPAGGGDPGPELAGCVPGTEGQRTTGVRRRQPVPGGRQRRLQPGRTVGAPAARGAGQESPGARPAPPSPCRSVSTRRCSSRWRQPTRTPGARRCGKGSGGNGPGRWRCWWWRWRC